MATKSSDVVVIGGGVVGTAITYYLAKRGREVCNLEQSGIASGTSGRCDGRITISDQVPGDSCRLAKTSLDMFAGLSAELDYDIEWSRHGTLLLMENEQEFESAKRHCARMAAAGMPLEVIEQNELREREPHIADDVSGALDVTCDGSVNPMALAQGFSHAAQRLGATVDSHAKVIDIGRDRSGAVSHVVTEGGTIATRHIVDAAGMWAPDLGKMVGLDIPIKPRQGQILVVERGSGVVRHPVQEFGYIVTRLESSVYERVMTPEMKEFGIAFAYEPTEAGTGLIGTSRRFVGRDTSVSPAVLRELARRAIRFYPKLRDAHAIRSYAGLRPYTPDHLPIISGTEVPGFYIAAGHEGNGIVMSAVTGEIMACIVCGEATPVDVRPFTWTRFSGSALSSAGAHLHPVGTPAA